MHRSTTVWEGQVMMVRARFLNLTYGLNLLALFRYLLCDHANTAKVIKQVQAGQSRSGE